MVNKIASILYEKVGIFACSIDIANSNGKDLLVEVGGFQVSDIDKNGDKFIIDNFYKSLFSSMQTMIDNV
jgi:glutathione synthase/RimK-type ligase-like ATP-grasp enzyme